MGLDFNKYALKGIKLLKDLAKELGHPEDISKAGRKLRAVLHAIRDQLTFQESLKLLSQLPMFLKAVYVENWKYMKKKKRVKHMDGLINEIKKYDPRNASLDFQDDDEVENAAVVVFIVLRKYISLGELEDIRSVLPRDLKYLTGNLMMV